MHKTFRMALVANNQLIYKGKSVTSVQSLTHSTAPGGINSTLTGSLSWICCWAARPAARGWLAHQLSQDRPTVTPPWPDSSQGGVASEGTSCMIQQQQTPAEGRAKMERGDWESFWFKICLLHHAPCSTLNPTNKSGIRVFAALERWKQH